MAHVPRLKVLADEALDRIHEASIQLLEKTGVVFECEESVTVFKKNAVKVDGSKVFVPGKLAETAVETAPATFSWTARNDAQSVVCGEGVAPTPNVGPVFCQDLDRGRRAGTIEDFVNFQKLSQASSVIRITGATPVAPQDVFPASERSLHMLYQSIKHSDKPLQGSCDSGVKAAQQLEMVEISMGQKGFLDTHYCIGVSCNPLSPLAYGTEVLETLMAYAKRRQPVFLLPCIMAGITGPMSLWGTIVQQNAEILAGAALTYLVNPETPIVYCPASTAADMRSANVACAAPEQFLINTPGLQLAIDRYRLPTRILAGMTASKTEDIQAGAETTMSLLIGLLSGAHIVVQSFGVLDSIITTSYEKFVIDEEIFSGALRFCRGVDTSDSETALQAIQDVGAKGSFLMHPTTMQQYKNHWCPIHNLASWENYESWKERGGEDILVRANRKWKDILATSPDSLIDSELDKALQDYLRKSCQ
jgi:trimethylamine--corrinoid protein Co-methyltransferase